ncbi:MAG: Sfum_1244 family protein [Thermodesulfobacteriota bacterium]
MFDLDSIIAQVQENCDISDSRYAGIYSICGLALRLRDLYKWDTGLEPWVERESSEILEWIGGKEQKWNELAEKDLGEITILGRRYDPFDTKSINALLGCYGLFYGAGYAHSMKPTFFLAPIENKKEIDGHSIYILGHELARDLFTTPALSQEDCVLVRQKSAMAFLWDKIQYIKASGRHALNFALEVHGLGDKYLKLHPYMEAITTAETGTFIYHELGEIRDTIFDRNLWREIIAAFPHTPTELLVRTIKDLLADTNEYGTLSYIIREQKTASLAFYVAFLEALPKRLFPEITDTFCKFTERRSWDVIEQAVLAGYNTAQKYAGVIIDIYQLGKEKHDGEWMQAEISKRLLAPLGIVK